ncbi:MAG: YqcC family protein [Ferruginibacter sp.]
MNEYNNIIADKIKELRDEMELTGLWQKESPGWVTHFEEKIFADGKDFAQWLQYVFIPNHIQTDKQLSTIKDKKMIVPQAINFFGDDVRKGKLLQILIEIDSLL